MAELYKRYKVVKFPQNFGSRPAFMIYDTKNKEYLKEYESLFLKFKSRKDAHQFIKNIK